MYTYYMVFEYTANSNSYKITKTVELDLPICVDDIEDQEKIVQKENENRKVRCTFYAPIEPSRRPPKKK